MTSYQPIRECQSLACPIRELTYQVCHWPSLTPTPSKTVMMLHGWMDIGRSFQFVVDALPDTWEIFAPDWRGFGGSLPPAGGADSYWFMDYLGDLDALADALIPGQAVNLVGHSMGGNIATVFSGVRPARVRRLVNLEGMGLRETLPEQAPQRIATWLDELRTPQRFSDYDDLSAVAARLMSNNPRLTADKAKFIARFWAQPQANAQGRYELRADPQHKQVNPYLYRVDETLACWSQISAPVLLVTAQHQNPRHKFVTSQAYQQRLTSIKNLQQSQVSDAGHMMHHDQPKIVAGLIRDFFT